jgi:RNA-directed DNA polymerase
MKDRTMQALYLMALDPVAETTADSHSFGFRKERSTADVYNNASLTCPKQYLRNGFSKGT